MGNLYRALFYSFIFMMAPSLYAQSSWTINKYKIVQQSPDEKRHSAKQEAALQKERDEDFSGQIPGLRTAQIKELENYLEDVGKKYQKLGFNEPSITTKTKKNDAYEIFFHDYPDTYPVAYFLQKYSVSGVVKQATHIRDNISLDSSRAIPKSNNFNLTSKAYEDLAHELFHAIQKSYPVFKSHSDLGDWITEGTATAIGEDIALQLGKLNVVDRWGSSKSSSMRRWGLRTYSNTLWVPDLEGEVSTLYSSQEGHRTSGFWRFIGEYISSGGHPGVEQVKPPSYRYLAKLFERPIYGPTNDLKELDWLDSFLKENKSQVGKGLGSIYPYFITVFTHYATGRMKFKRKAIINAWHKCLFTSGLDCRKTIDIKSDQEACEKVTIDESATAKESSTIDFRPVSGRCIKVEYSGSSVTLDTTIKIESDDENVVKSIRNIGMQTKNKKIKVLVSKIGQLAGGTFFGEWTFQNVVFQRETRNGEQAVLFLVSNVAEFASETAESPSVKFTFNYSMSKTNLNLSK